jgi:predicted amidophosphoribosyltransferase
MKYCPHCEAEYQERIDVCADCDAQLISQQAFEKRKEEEERFHEDTKTLVKVFTLRDRFEADVITRELEKEGIPVLIRSFRDTAYDGIYIPQKGWGEVRVPEKAQERAVAIIDALEQVLEAGKVSISEEEDLLSCPCCGKELLPENKICSHCNKPLGNGSGVKDLE